MSDRPTPFEQQLAAALGAPIEPIAIPAAVDEAILALARERATEVQRTRRRGRVLRWAVPAGVAAAAAVALVLVLPVVSSREPAGASSAPVAAGPDDINRDGRVDILDAYALARAERDAARPGEIERVALAAVALRPEAAR
jgi:hypothetical protein